ncbi:MAG TPA: carboxypeptidase-like regulatory domain-containing protein [Gemmataceae bacterium]|nr:carboxypeptidase-like regulatory domain-containing protein [Gemmataceae bacterium]
MPRARLLWLPAMVGVIALASCNSAEGGPDTLPKNPGTVVVVVRDTAGSPVPNVRIEITEPSNIGGFFGVAAWTDTNGKRSFPGIPAGERPVAITLPAGYGAGPEGLTQTVTVRTILSVTVTFTLVRQ